MKEIPPPTDHALKEAIEIVNEFSRELLDEAGRIAARSGAEQSHPEHMREAAQHLYRGYSTRKQQALLAAGGVIAGIGGGAVVSFLQDSTPNTAYIGASTIVMVVGVIMTTLGIGHRP